MITGPRTVGAKTSMGMELRRQEETDEYLFVALSRTAAGLVTLVSEWPGGGVGRTLSARGMADR